MHPYDQKLIDDAKEREQAWHYRKASGALATVHNTIANLAKQVGPYQEQVNTLERLLKLIDRVDHKIQGHGGFLLRGQLLKSVEVGLTDQQRRLDDVSSRLATLKGELPRLQADVAQYAPQVQA